MRTAHICWIATAAVAVALGAVGRLLTPPLVALLGMGVGALTGALLHGTTLCGMVRRLLFLPAARPARPPSPTGSVLTGSACGLLVTGLFSLLAAGALTLLVLLIVVGVAKILHSPDAYSVAGHRPQSAAATSVGVRRDRDTAPRAQLTAVMRVEQSAELATAVGGLVHRPAVPHVDEQLRLAGGRPGGG